MYFSGNSSIYRQEISIDAPIVQTYHRNHDERADVIGENLGQRFRARPSTGIYQMDEGPATKYSLE
jgi:hypothetical protein